MVVSWKIKHKIKVGVFPQKKEGSKCFHKLGTSTKFQGNSTSTSRCSPWSPVLQGTQHSGAGAPNRHVTAEQTDSESVRISMMCDHMALRKDRGPVLGLTASFFCSSQFLDYPNDVPSNPLQRPDPFTRKPRSLCPH